jgi:phenylacetate-CoA ligase
VKTMLFSEWIRRAGFWSVDFLSGSPIRNHYVDIRNIMENGSKPDVSKMYLNGILKYATENVPFYMKFKAFDSIQSFPVINKNIIRGDYQAFQSPEFSETSVVNMRTSGSTGTPFVVRQDKNKRKRVHAEMIYFWGKAGYQTGMRYVFFRIWTSLNRRSKLSAWARNILMWEIKRLDEGELEDFRNTIKSDRKIKMLLGYPSVFENLANHLVTRVDSSEFNNINTLIAFGEALPEFTREKIKRVFKGSIVSLYSNQENGMLAQECVENKEFHVNSASYHMELLKMDSDAPVRVGELGRIVVTDLFNHAMPLIRYDTGDTGIWKEAAECGWHSQVLSSIQGARIDLISDTRGNKINPHTISVFMWPFNKLLQYQFIQETARQYTLKLNGAEGYYEDATFVDLFKGVLGEDAQIRIEHVHEIPVLDSGKRKRVVSNYVKERT